MTITTERCLLSLGVCALGWQPVDTTVIGARTALPTADQLGLTCTPAELTLAAGTAGTVTCSIVGLATLEAPVTMTVVTVAVPAGWTITSGTGSVSGSILTIVPSAVVSTSVPYGFSFTLSPSCTSAGTAESIGVASSFSYREVTSPGPTATVTGALSPTPSLPSASAQAVDFGTLVWEEEESGYPTARREITISISVPNESCAAMADAWAIQLGASSLTGPAGATISPSAIVYAGPSGGVPAGVTAISGPQPLSPTGTRIATGNPSAHGGRWNITLEITPPSNTPPGAYTGTLVVDVVSTGS